jgi:hypothetical protein
MNIKKIARPINKAKNEFLQWLRNRDADNVEVFIGEKEVDDGWDYYRDVTAFIGNAYYSARFMIWNGVLTIEFKSDEPEHDCTFNNVDDFLKLIR